MPVPENTYRIVIAGNTVDNYDEWNCVWHATITTGLATGDLYNFAKLVYDEWADHIMNPSTDPSIATGVTMNKVTLYSLDAANHVVDQWTYVDPAGPAGSEGGDALPSEVSVCASLVTARDGRSYRGRTFLPQPGKNVCSLNGYLGTAYPPAIADQVATVLSDLNLWSPGAVTFPAVMCVLSVKLGVMTPITAVRVGDTFDVQRRRRNDRPEIYSSFVVAPHP